MGKTRKNVKLPIMVYVTPEIKKHILSNPDFSTFSEWVSAKYIQEYLDTRCLVDKMEKLRGEIDRIVEVIDHKRNKPISCYPPLKALKYLKTETSNTVRLYKERGALHKFNELFNLGFTMRQFRIWIQNLNKMDLDEIEFKYSSKSNTKKGSDKK